MHIHLMLVVMSIFVLAMAGSAEASTYLEFDIHLDLYANSSTINTIYHKYVRIEYSLNSTMSELFDGREWSMRGQAGPEDPAVQNLTQSINDRIHNIGSIASVDDIYLDYFILFTGHSSFTYMYLDVKLNGSLSDYVIARNQNKTIVDMLWYDISSDIPVIIDGVDVNNFLNVLKIKEPTLYEIIRSGGANVEYRLGDYSCNSNQPSTPDTKTRIMDILARPTINSMPLHNPLNSASPIFRLPFYHTLSLWNPYPFYTATVKDIKHPIFGDISYTLSTCSPGTHASSVSILYLPGYTELNEAYTFNNHTWERHETIIVHSERPFSLLPYLPLPGSPLFYFTIIVVATAAGGLFLYMCSGRHGLVH